jgi:hypothetical protein
MLLAVYYYFVHVYIFLQIIGKSAKSLFSKMMHLIEDLSVLPMSRVAVNSRMSRRSRRNCLMAWLKAEYSLSRVLSDISVWIFDFQIRELPAK